MGERGGIKTKVNFDLVYYRTARENYYLGLYLNPQLPITNAQCAMSNYQLPISNFVIQKNLERLGIIILTEIIV